MTNSKQIFIFFILLALSIKGYGQNDTNKRYIDKLIITCDQGVKDLTFILKNKNSKLEILNKSTIKDVAFYYQDSVDLYIKYDHQEFALKNISQYFPYPDFVCIVQIHLYPRKILCTEIVQNDSRGNEYVITLNCKVTSGTSSEHNYISIVSSSNIMAGKGIYKELKN